LTSVGHVTYGCRYADINYRKSRPQVHHLAPGFRAGRVTDVTPRYYRVKDVAALLSISQGEVRRLIEAGTLHRRYIGEGRHYYRVTAASVEAYEATLSAERA
jgi:excisionase family DNA binding protein